ncbi:T9SS type A sorting domain-containing protein [candidate division TA06 bacterium]|nr:T9SS type A sorting domain-containing protein [candidate division TA06 bacterium]
MKKSLILVLAVALMLGFAYQAQAAPKAMNTIEDNTSTAPRMGPAKINVVGNKAVLTSVVDTIQNIRTIMSASARNMVCSPGATLDNDTIQIAYLRGVAATYALWHAYSLDGGATWTNNLVDNTARPRYPAAVVGDNDEGNGIYRPLHMAYHRQNEMQMYYCREEGSLGDGLFTSYQISNSSDANLWIPNLNRNGSCMSVSGFDNGTLGTAWATFSNDMGTTWNPSRMVAYPTFGDWAFGPILMHYAHQESVIAFMPLPWMSFDLSGDANQPVYWMSTDSGVTFTGPIPIVPETLLPQFAGACWWYNYDAIMVDGVPHLAFDLTDYEGVLMGPNGSGMFHATPKDPSDYSQGWKVTRVTGVEDPITGDGVYAGNPSIGADASGNLFVSWCDNGHSTATNGILVAASTDGGDHWTLPYTVVEYDTLETYDMYPQEMSREVGTAVHIIACDGIQTPDAGGLGPLYHFSVPVTEILATGVGPLVNTPLIYSVGKPMGTGDTTLAPAGDSLYFSWSTGFGYGGIYEAQASQDSTFATGVGKYFTKDNEFTSVGMPATGKWFWRVNATLGTTSAWSDVYTFTYGGTSIDSLFGVEGQTQSKPVHSFALNQSRPNPVKGSAEIAFNLPKAGSYSITIYNILGQPVNVLEGRGNAGANKVSWNSCDKNGQKVSNGVYLYTLKSLGNTATKKLVVVR